jgi:hypothetical protein
LSTIDDIRSGLATRLATITGLRTSSEIPDNPNPPIAIVNLRNVQYDQAFGKGLAVYNFVVTVIVGRAAERIAQRKLNDYCDNTGSQSVKTAIEGDKTLGGKAFDTRVVSLDNIGNLQLNDATYLAAEFSVAVYAN